MGKTAFLVVFGTTLVLGSMLVGLNKRTVTQNEIISDHYVRMISRNIANSAANIAVNKLSMDYDWRSGLATTNMVGGQYSVNVEDINFDTTLTMQRVKVTAMSDYQGRIDTVNVVVAKAPFSHYAQFTANWPSTNSYATGDSIYGPIHTNTQFKFWGNPVFFGKVTQVDTSYLTEGPANPQFLGGIQVGADSIPMPDLSTGLQALVDSANAGGDLYADDVWLNFHGDGSYDYYVGSTFGGTYDGTKNMSSYNGIIMSAEGKNIHVQGTFNGQGTIYSGRHIFIEDDIVYADDPRTNPDSQDMLGLVASRHVEVAYTIPNQTDVEIHGAIMALDSKFQVETLSGVGILGTMTTYGSTIQKNRGSRATGYVDGGGNVVLTNGYNLKALYDNRFLHAGPPVFPSTEKAMVYSWQEDTEQTVGYGVTTGLAGGSGVGGSGTEEGQVEDPDLVTAKMEVQRIRDEFQDMVEDNPGTQLETKAALVVLLLDNVTIKLYDEPPNYSSAMGQIAAAQAIIQDDIIDAGLIGAAQGNQYITDLNTVISILSDLDND